MPRGGPSAPRSAFFGAGIPRVREKEASDLTAFLPLTNGARINGDIEGMVEVPGWQLAVLPDEFAPRCAFRPRWSSSTHVPSTTTDRNAEEYSQTTGASALQD